MKYSNLTVKVAVPVQSSSLQGPLQQSRYSHENVRNHLSSLFASNFNGRGGSVFVDLGQVETDEVGGADFESSAVVSASFPGAPANNATFRIGAQTLTWKTAAPASENEVSSSTASGSAGHLANAINAHSVLSNVFVASATGTTCSIFYKPVDAAGLLLDVSSSSTNVVVGNEASGTTKVFAVSGSTFSRSVFSPISVKKGI